MADRYGGRYPGGGGQDAVAMVTAEQLLVAGAGLGAVASMPRGAWLLRAALGLLGIAAIAWGAQRHHLAPIVAGGALTLVNAVQLGLAWFAGRDAGGFTPEEEAFRARCFARLPAAAFRQMLDAGLWINGRAGEVLVPEGEPVGQLLYLSEGEVRITAGGRAFATSGPGHFFGELDVLAHTPAIATIALVTAGRFWCIGVQALERLLAENPALQPAIEIAMASELREKLRERSRQLVEAALR